MSEQKDRQTSRYTYEDFREIIAKLRAPDGCPWDREQTHATLRNCMIEEAYEVVDGIRILDETGDAGNLCEELGDVLMQVFLHSQIAEEEGLFKLEDVVDGISRKMIYRHPHVFGTAEASTSEDVLQNWEELKKKEKGNRTPEEELAAVPHSLPALIRASKILKKTDGYYGEFQELEQSLQEASDGIMRLRETESTEALRAEAGNILLQLCNGLRLLGINGEEVLTEALEKLLKLHEIAE